MPAVIEIVSLLEKVTITKELLEVIVLREYLPPITLILILDHPIGKTRE